METHTDVDVRARFRLDAAPTGRTPRHSARPPRQSMSPAIPTSYCAICSRAARTCEDAVEFYNGQRSDSAEHSDRHPVTVEFMIFVVSALTSAKVREVVNELDRRDPLHHLEPELIFAAQP